MFLKNYSFDCIYYTSMISHISTFLLSQNPFLRGFYKVPARDGSCEVPSSPRAPDQGGYEDKGAAASLLGLTNQSRRGHNVRNTFKH